MNIDERKKRMDKIIKCLRLSASSNENEAAAALRQAQKLMEAWQITEDDLAGVGYTQERIQMPIQVNKKAVPNQLLALVYLISKAFGVRCIISYSKRLSDVSYDIKIYGPDTRVPMAAYAATVVMRACNAAWARYLKENDGWLRGQRGARALFQLEWIEAITEKVVAIGFTDEEQAATDLVVTKEHGGKELKKASSITISGSAEAAHAGRAAGSDFKLHRPMDTDRNKLCHAAKE